MVAGEGVEVEEVVVPVLVSELEEVDGVWWMADGQTLDRDLRYDVSAAEYRLLRGNFTLHASDVRIDIGEVQKVLGGPSARVSSNTVNKCCMIYGLDIMKPQGSKCSDGVSSGSYDDQSMLPRTLCQNFTCLACRCFQFILPVNYSSNSM